MALKISAVFLVLCAAGAFGGHFRAKRDLAKTCVTLFNNDHLLGLCSEQEKIMFTNICGDPDTLAALEKLTMKDLLASGKLTTKVYNDIMALIQKLQPLLNKLGININLLNEFVTKGTSVGTILYRVLNELNNMSVNNKITIILEAIVKEIIKSVPEMLGICKAVHACTKDY